MRIDNSMAKLWRFCPAAFWERYIAGIEKDRDPTPLQFGSRVHRLLEEHFAALGGLTVASTSTDGPLADEGLEAEAQEMVAAYRAHYPAEDFDVIAVEQTFEVPLPGGRHTLAGKFDGVIRWQATGRLGVLEHKTERRGGQDNHPEAWAARAQASLYMWAAGELYGERPAALLLDVLTRRSPKGECPASFPERQHILRGDDQLSNAVRDIVWVADQIEEMTLRWPTGDWPQTTDHCRDGWKRCDYYLLHIHGRSDATLTQFKKAERYLDF